MPLKLRRDAIAAELGELTHLLARLPPNALLSRRSLEAKANALRTELAELADASTTTASAALFFGGARVQGSRAIDADFAARSLKAFQDLVSKKTLERVQNPMGQRGPLAERDIARLNIVGTAAGSFGFLLEENGADAPPLFPSAVKEALSAAMDLLSGFATEDDESFGSLLFSIDPRVLVTVKDFFKVLHDGEGTVRIVEDERETTLNRSAVERAFSRADQSQIDEDDVPMVGRLIGVLPVTRSFEFVRDDTSEVLKGKVGPQFSNEFLQRIEREAITLGKRWRATIRIKKVERPGASRKVDYTLLDLQELA